MNRFSCCILLCAGLLYARQVPTEENYAGQDGCIDAKNCHTFYGMQLAQRKACRLAACTYNWCKPCYQLPSNKKN